MIAALLVDQKRYPLTEESGARFRHAFLRHKYVRFPAFFQEQSFDMLRSEVDRLRRLAIRRDLKMEGSGNTLRKMSTLGGHVVGEYSTLVPDFYHDDQLLEFLRGVAGEPVLGVPDPVENHVLNCLHQTGDIHGGHVDTYAFAFNISIDGTTPEDGGALEFVPGSVELEDLEGSSVQRAWHEPGDCYFLRTDQAVHRVSSLLRPEARRTILNFAYANPATLDLESYSTSSLYGGEPESPAASPPPSAADVAVGRPELALSNATPGEGGES